MLDETDHAGPIDDARSSPERGPVSSAVTRKEFAVLYTIAVVLLVLWLLGLVSGYTVGAFIHVLLVIALVLFVVGLISGRRMA